MRWVSIGESCCIKDSDAIILLVKKEIKMEPCLSVAFVGYQADYSFVVGDVEFGVQRRFRLQRKYWQVAGQ